MTVNEIVDELRATRPQASDALRLQVLAVASQPIVRRPSLLDRFRLPRRLLLAVPAAAGLAVAAAIAIGVTRPAQEAQEAVYARRAEVEASTMSQGVFRWTAQEAARHAGAATGAGDEHDS